MDRSAGLVVAAMVLLAAQVRGGDPPRGALAGQRPRVIVSSDIGGSDPDDFQSMVHLLLYADVLDLEGLIASPPGKGRAEHVLEVLAAYETDYPHLVAHSVRYPKADALRAVTKQGAVGAARAVGVSGATDGSRWIVERARAADPQGRPLWVLVWGSLTDVAQAVHDQPDVKKALRVHSIGSWNTAQDRAARDYLPTTRRPNTGAAPSSAPNPTGGPPGGTTTPTPPSPRAAGPAPGPSTSGARTTCATGSVAWTAPWPRPGEPPADAVGNQTAGPRPGDETESSGDRIPNSTIRECGGTAHRRAVSATGRCTRRTPAPAARTLGIGTSCRPAATIPPTESTPMTTTRTGRTRGPSPRARARPHG